ncbi:RTX iron-regulated FrpC family protein [Neisseria meningitidis]|uniref:RTX iron-regulated FrpC family protein n=1 Tax=Neisseria meningitidis TaxID=487 RepID=UPI000F45177D|nr:RTX iron-regulated FrpC family protein [Neisseria meningitidis]RNK01151.1 FrpC operon protein [Neisseria meningitidis]
MRPYATTIYQLFILFIGSVFTMTSCEPVNEQTSFNNPEPMTGFEHTVTFDFQGTKMVIPYGYLARYTQNNATKWLSDTPGQDAYSINLIEISVYYKKTDQGWVLEPYNQQNKAHFIQFLRDGLDSVDDIVIRKDACSLSTTMGERLLTYGVKKMPSAYPEYEAYEDKRHIPENPYFHEFYYIKKGENPAIITHWNNRVNQAEEDNYSTSVGSCINGFTVQYYPFIREKQQLTQQELVGYHQQVEQLVQSFVNNSSKK